MCLTLTICNGHDHIRVRSDYNKEKDVVNAHDHRMEVTKKNCDAETRLSIYN